MLAAWLIAAVPLAHGIGAWHGVAHARLQEKIGPNLQGHGHTPSLDVHEDHAPSTAHDCKAFEAATSAATPPSCMAAPALIAEAPAPTRTVLPLPFPHRAWAHAPARAPPTRR